jgi:hypothetical protein
VTTVQKIGAAVKQLREKHINYAKRHRFAAGVSQLSLAEFSSVNAAGRKLGGNRWTGESRLRRTVTDTSLANQLQQLLVNEALGSCSGYWYCSLDHSQFGSFCIAVLAVSHRKGRAIPIWCQVNVSAGALITPLLVALEELFQLLTEVAPRLQLVLVMDRWFASDKLFALFERHGVYFIARSKGDKLVQLPWDPSWWREPLGDISHEELRIAYRKHTLRFIRSEYKEGMKGNEVWFLLTNLPEPSSKGNVDGLTRRQILNRYAERFEIEEAFKDIKWLQRLKWQQIRKPEVIRTLLLFVFLGWWLLWRYGDRPPARAQTKVHRKKQLSWFRHTWEQFQATITAQHWLLA